MFVLNCLIYVYFCNYHTEMHSKTDAGKVQDTQKTKLKTESPTEKVLITICSADRKIKKTFMSLPSRKDVIEKGV